MTATIQETIATLRETLQGYIEATYHIADPGVVAQRRALLDEAGGVFQTPYLESTPKYETGDTYAKMTDIPAAAREAYARLADASAGKALIYDPPYSHQSEAIRTILRDRKNLMIMTGTGSGKTESFLLPILGKLAIEAKDRPNQFADYSAVRAMVLYPMNALVNDQLGRLRLLFGDQRVMTMFQDWTGRPARFARYTSRTPYAGVRTKDKDRVRLKSIGDFFVEIEDAALRYARDESVMLQEDARAQSLYKKLVAKGKWPAKKSVSEWYGSGPWMPKGVRRRAITLIDDTELITRDEVQVGAPDLLITNYSMLEYMMMRPIERTIFEQTRAWLEACPDEKFLIVLDEAHLYRGAQGAEVGLLLRRLRDRLAIPKERFQVICATASFSDEGKKNAGQFGEQLTGVDAASFVPVTGSLKLRPKAAMGSPADLATLGSIDLGGFFSEESYKRAVAVKPFLVHRGVAPSVRPDADLHAALAEYGPFSLLVNETMRAARSFEEIREIVFGRVDPDMGDRAINALLAMGSRARLKPDDASLLPCRVHAFYRGLPGLWACMDPACTECPDSLASPIGKLYAQPRDRCACGARVLQYFTCRYCGTSYARAYAMDATQPSHIFAEAGRTLLTSHGLLHEFQALDIMLEPPSDATKGRPVNFDLLSGLINPEKLGPRNRLVYLTPNASSLSTAKAQNDAAGDDEDDSDDGSAGAGPGQFVPCGCCGRSMRGKASVQDHVTKGDQPFQALVSAQIRVQPPNPTEATEFAPLRGRKVLVFSDSRQVAARLAPSLQVFSLRDTLRALLPLGYRMLDKDQTVSQALVLDAAWIAVVVAAHRLGVRLRPELDGAEVMPRVMDVPSGQMPGASTLFKLMQQKPPTNLTRAIVDVLRDNLLGLEALAIASIVEAPSETNSLKTLPPLPGLAESPDDKIAVARAWLRTWSRRRGIWFKDMPASWWGTGGIVKSHKGDFQSMNHILSTPQLRTAFKKGWIPRLLNLFTENAPGGQRLVARNLSLEIGGDWVRCGRCTSVHRPIETVARCIECGSAEVKVFDPDTDVVFKARKGFYRDPVVNALYSDQPALMSLIAAEHTAQLNAARADTAFSQAEQHEMQFQDIDLAWRDIDQHKDTSVDVLSSTTTMEVGIDIGDLSGVALRNMPPGRANYQQRAGRAGRRGNAVATVIAFGSADSHDDHYFTKPKEMIRGQVVDPRLTLENPDIARRHIRAFLLQRYHEDRLPAIDPSDPNLANLFSVLGTVGDFLGDGPINRQDLQSWLVSERASLRSAIDGWLPLQLSPQNRTELLDGFLVDLLRAVDEALVGVHDLSAGEDPEGEETNATVPWSSGDGEQASTNEEQEEPAAEADPQPDNDASVDSAAMNLLDRLLYWGILPRYAFPTDVAPFYVFSPNSTGYRAEMEFAPSQGLNVALSQYAPNKQIWIKGKQYTSKAIFSPYPNERKDAWATRRLYYECDRCGHAKTDTHYDASRRGERLTCEACHTPGSFGPAKPWFRPPGFAHPWGQPAPSVPDEPNETAYATRAKLTMTAEGTERGEEINANIRALATRQHLLVSNSGPDGDGYDYCVKCGRIESITSPECNLTQPHPLPYPNDNDPLCLGFVSKGIVLGTDFPTDIALFSLRFDAPFRLPPTNDETASAMRTICEALAKAACRILDLEAGEILAEYRPALNDSGAAGTLVEVFLYDTLAGGAGFSPQLATRGVELFETALKTMEECPENCDSSCYRCLRSFRNKLDHSLLDRFVGIQLVRHLLTGKVAQFDAGRATRSLSILAADFERQFSDEFSVKRHFGVASAPAPVSLTNKVTGGERWIDVSSPVAPTVGVLGSGTLGTILVDDLRIRRHLGGEVVRVLDLLK
jgi:ATP-dependent helicase YprA (DUF1998 family)